MAFVQFSRVSLAFADRDILDNVSLNLASGTKAALAGANGSGKSTLMKVLAGSVSPDGGERAIQKGTQVSYLPQSGIVHSGCSLIDEVEKAFTRGYELSLKLEEIGEMLSSCDPSDVKTTRLVEEHHEVQLALESSGWHRKRSLSEQTLLGLGFEIADMGRDVGEFSGGWQMRIALAKILLENPDILLLDEPTNYLDLEARNWLENWLKDFEGGFLIVSHDRYFLDVTIHEVYELFGGTLKRYIGNYTKYEQVRAVELESLIKRYEQQREEIEKTEDFIRRFRYNASKAAIVQDRVKRLEKIERIEIPESLKKMHFSFPPAPHTGRIVLTTHEISRMYGQRQIIQKLDMVVEKGERLVVVGRNGAGKSTLLRMIAGVDASSSGTIQLGAGVAAGYFSQDNAESLTGTKTILDLLESEAPLDLIPRLRDMLASFLFRGDDIHKEISVLSGGEKSRLSLLRLLLKPINLLILDEPTNHLDLHSKDILLDALSRFGGTIIFVSHDRAFIESLATRVIELTATGNGLPSKVRNFPGNYRYYIERLDREASENSFVDQVKSVSGAHHSNDVKETQSSYADSKRIKAEKRKLEKEEERILEETARVEDSLKAQKERLCDPLVYSCPIQSREVQVEIERLSKEIEILSTKWEDITIELEAYI